MNYLPFENFICELDNKTKKRPYKSELFGNTYFYYWEDDNELQDEIAYYTAKTNTMVGSVDDNYKIYI